VRRPVRTRAAALLAVAVLGATPEVPFTPTLPGGPTVPPPTAAVPAPTPPAATPPAATPSGSPSATSGPVPAAPVLAAVGAGPRQPSTAGLRRVLDPLLRRTGLGSAVSAQVVDLTTGRTLYERRADQVAVPASAAKLLTAAAALGVYGADERLRTTVLDGGPGKVVLVGGGDVLLAAGRGRPGDVVGRAGLADLADRAARGLLDRGRTSAVVLVDDSLFTGPAVTPSWAPDVAAGFVAPVTAIAVNAGTRDPRAPLVAGEAVPRDGDPSLAAARTFARLLSARGVRVSTPVRRGSAPAGAPELARVESAPVARLVEHALSDSDNTVAEVLARMVAVRTGEPGSAQAAGPAVLAQLRRLGIDTSGARLGSGSGLGTGTLVSARTLSRTLVTAASAERGELRAVLSGLPVAGASGTLADRFAGGGDRAALGVVRAKTGTLTGASSLAGTVVDADGRLLGFVVLADRVRSTLAARSVLDATAAALARCGCR